MILSFWDSLNKVSNNIEKFVMNNYDEPFFWLILFGVLLAIAIAAISSLADK